MPQYVVNRIAQANGDHEVHKEGCIYFPSSYVDLGQHAGCASAVAQAKQHYSRANGCYTCARECHTS